MSLMDEEHREIVRRYKSGESMNTVARAVGRSSDFVRNVLIAEGVERRSRKKAAANAGRKPKHTFAPAQERRICLAYEDGLSLRECGERFGVHMSVIRRVLLKHEVKLRKRTGAK